MRTKAVIHLDRLKKNIEKVQKMLPEGCRITAVLKGDAYGHGMIGVYPVFRVCGITDYAVSVWEEGQALRNAGARTENILVLGDTPDEMQQYVVKYGLTQTIFDADAAEKLNEKAKAAGVVQPVQIKIDTGMSRLGFWPDERCIEPVKRIASMSNLKITGAYTHFMCADDLHDPRTNEQLAKFTKTIEMLRNAGVDIPFVHTANSPSVMLRPKTYMDAVRAGDVFLGLNPIDTESWLKSGFEEVLTWHTKVAMVKTVPAGTDVGYGATFTATEDTVIATIPVGFADGYSRHLSNKGYVMINGVKCPITGRVCMDQFMVDASEAGPVKRGDEVILLGEGISINDMAEMLDECCDEIVLRISKRVPRVYI